ERGQRPGDNSQFNPSTEIGRRGWRGFDSCPCLTGRPFVRLAASARKRGSRFLSVSGDRQFAYHKFKGQTNNRFSLAKRPFPPDPACMRTARLLGEGRSFYHVVSRVVDRRKVFKPRDKEVF